MVLIRRFSGERRAFTTVGLLRIITNALRRLSGHHVGCSEYMFDGAVTPEQALPQAVMTVAESGLPGYACVCGSFERGHDRVRYLTTVFLPKHTPCLLRSGRLRQIQRGQEPSDLMEP